jgi:hypothetical protein
MVRQPQRSPGSWPQQDTPSYYRTINYGERCWHNQQ